MKKTSTLLLSLFVLAGCSKENGSGSAATDGTVIDVAVSDIATRVGYLDAGAPDYTLETGWNDTDRIAVIYTGSYASHRFEIVPSTISGDGKSASFQTNETVLTHGKPFLVFYPYEQAPLSRDAMISPEGQMQNGNDTFDHLSLYDFMQSVEYYGHGNTVSVRRMMALLTFDLSLPVPESKDITELVISSTNDGLLKKKSLDGTTEYLARLSLGVVNVSASESVPVLLHLMVFPGEFKAGDELLMTLKCSDGSEYRYSKRYEERFEIEAGKRYINRFTDVMIVNYVFAEDVSLPADGTTYSVASYLKSTRKIDEITNGIRPIGTYAFTNGGRELQPAQTEGQYPYGFVAADTKKGQMMPDDTYSTVMVSPACPFTKYEDDYYVVITRGEDVAATAPFDTTVEGDTPVTVPATAQLMPLGANATFSFGAPAEEDAYFEISNLILHNAGQRGWYHPVTGATLRDFAASGSPDLTSGSTAAVSVEKRSGTLYESESFRLFAGDYISLTDNQLKIAFKVTYSGGTKDVETVIKRAISDGYSYNFEFSLNSVDKNFSLTVTSWRTVDVNGSID